jgi:hypothetical protein
VQLKLEAVAVGNLTKDVINGLNNYFTYISRYGYMPTSSGAGILSLILIDDLINGPMKHFITGDDSRKLEQFVNCLKRNNCIMNSNIYNPTLDELEILSQHTFFVAEQ